MDDSRIIELFYERSEQAIAELSKKYGAVCSRVARNILGSSRDAEECVNDAYLGAWNTIPPQRPDPLMTYICRIVRNISIARYHSNTAAKRGGSYDVALSELEDCLAAGETVDSELSVRELTCVLNRFLDTLEPENRAMFVCRYWYGDPVSELAERFRISNNNVSVRLARIRGKLKKYLRKEGYYI